MFVSYSGPPPIVSTYKPPTMMQGAGFTNAANVYRRAISKPRYPNPSNKNVPIFITQSTGSETSYIAHRCISTDRSSGSVIQRRKAIATGKGKITPGQQKAASYSNNDVNTVRKHLNLTRNQGQIVPPKARGYLPNTQIAIRPFTCAPF